jgi:ketosteroid isomerase-like protein
MSLRAALDECSALCGQLFERALARMAILAAMSKQEIDQLLRGFYESLNEGDVDEVLDHCDPAVEVYKDPNVAAVVPPKGRREVFRYLESWLETWDHYRPEPEEFIQSGDKVVAFVNLQARPRRARFEIEERVADIFTVKHGKIANLRFYMEREKALETASL